MKITTIIVLLTLGVIGFTQLIGGHKNQVAAASPSFHFPGNRPAQPGPVKPVPQRLFYQQGPLIASTSGKFVYNFTIAVRSTIPASDVIECTGSASVFDTSGRTMEESAGVAATRGTSTATCAVTIPYSWPLAGASTDMVNLGFTISAPATGPSALPNRVSTQGFATIHVPTSGSTTTEVISATI
jgi:hypothetical protein